MEMYQSPSGGTRPARCGDVVHVASTSFVSTSLPKRQEEQMKPTDQLKEVGEQEGLSARSR